MRLKQCRRCGRLKEAGKACPACPPSGNATLRRESARDRGYDSWWEKYSVAYRRKHPWCVVCEAKGLAVPACLVDHIVPFRDHHGVIDEGLRRDPANHQSLCDARFNDCHNLVKKPIEDAHRGDPERLRREWDRLLDRMRRERDSDG